MDHCFVSHSFSLGLFIHSIHLLNLQTIINHLRLIDKVKWLKHITHQNEGKLEKEEEEKGRIYSWLICLCICTNFHWSLNNVSSITYISLMIHYGTQVGKLFRLMVTDQKTEKGTKFKKHLSNYISIKKGNPIYNQRHYTYGYKLRSFFI